MKSGPPAGGALPLLVLLVVCAITAGVAAVVAVERVSASRAGPVELGAATTGALGIGLLAPPAESIPSEAQVFRLNPAALAIDPRARREREAHPRTLATFRYLRAYPGAPPRIPHGLTPDEFRTGACLNCHERGGYSQRFAAYVPVTPHPEMVFCLQCHVGDDAATGISRPSSDPNDRCSQCHGPGGRPRTEGDATLNWRPAAWPRVARRTAGGLPPEIPHDLSSRGDCVACHVGPAAVAEVRTDHAEWASCRQCHVAPEVDGGVFSRPGPGSAQADSGGAP
jgi:cytochrome c-type protein NapB